MLDSLVRVSRRVGGAADLLATEMRPYKLDRFFVQEVRIATHSAYELLAFAARDALVNDSIASPG